MKLTSKTLRMLLGGLLASTLALTACGGGDPAPADTSTPDQPANNGQTSGTETSEPEAPHEEVTLTVSWWGNDERARTMDKAFALFMERNPHITVVAEPTGDPDSLFNRLSTDFAAGVGPDLFTLGGAKPQEYGGAGQLLDLSTVSDHVDLTPYEDFTTTNATVDGVLYGLPTGGNAIGLLVNETLFEEAGIELPSDDFTWPEFIEKAAAISAGSDGVVGLDLRIQDIIATYVGQLNDIGLYDWDGLP